MPQTPNEKVCPRCQVTNAVPALEKREYRCESCGLELAHLDVAGNGAIRGVFGWLLDIGAVVHERYCVETVLGKGGFGVTYLVKDLKLEGKRRALKEIPELLFDEHETKLLGRLNHPAIPDIIDRTTCDGMVYLVLEFGGSRTLKTEQERLKGQIPLFVLMPWIGQLCDALSYLHSQEPPVIHRDLKPDNVLLDDNDRVMLIDFGIAKESDTSTVTRTLGRAVTHGFSPPEQVMGTGTDQRSDVYALGAILYTLLTGHTPIPAHERVTGKTLDPISRYMRELPPLLESAIMQALDLNLNKRQQSIQELAQVLAAAGAREGTQRTVAVTQTEGLAAQASSRTGVTLPSVKLPTSPSSAAASSTGAALGADSATPPRKKRSGWMVGGSVSAVLVALLFGGYWLGFRDQDQGKSGVPVEDDTQAGMAREVTEPTKPLDPAVAVETPVQTAPEGSPPGSVPSPALETPVQVPSQALPTALVPSPKAATPVKAPSAASLTATASKPSVSAPASALPSVFSNEQEMPVATPSSKRSGSLMDAFNDYRQDALQATPQPDAPATPAAQDDATDKSKQQTASAPAKPAKRKRKTTRSTTKRSAASTQKKSTSSWNITYEGAQKRN